MIANISWKAANTIVGTEPVLVAGPIPVIPAHVSRRVTAVTSR